MEHPEIEYAMRTGYPSKDYLDWEREQEKDDNPVEDMFGSEILEGDKWFEDSEGRIVLEDNIDDYLIEVIGVEFFRALK
ncbi:YqaI family protein [Indiicoccus explosivorum]|uniref:YqaI family protein n=1 Tax=Indiicoccus explosivorum TaxID=1917864 RepID=UPI0013904897|nr:hypothetical protein [Indiicoccus explosivorum]